MYDQSANEEWRQQARHLKMLNEISRVVSSTLDLPTLYETIYAQISRVMDATLFFIALDRSDRDTVQFPYVREHGKRIASQEIPYRRSVTTHVIEQGVPLLFSSDIEYQRHARSQGLPEISMGNTGSEAMVFVPLNTGSRTIGALSVQSPRRGAYTIEDVQTLSVIATQAAVAIENARLYAQSQDAVRQMQGLIQVAQMVSGSLHVQTVLDSILVGMNGVLPYDFAAILLPDPTRKTLNLAAARRREGALQRAEGLVGWNDIPIENSIVGAVFSTGEAIHIEDTRQIERHLPSGIEGVFAEIIVSLKRADTVVGVLDVQRLAPGAFSHHELDLLRLFASHAAIAIENARLFSNQQNRVFELQAIQSIVQRLNPLPDIPSIANLINEELKGLIDYHSCRVLVLDAAEDVLVPISVADFDPKGMTVQVGQGITGWIAEHGKPQIVPNMLQDPRSFHIPGTEVREESMIGAPLIYQGRVQGVITLSKLGANQFDENSLRLLEIIAAQTAIAFDRARLYEKLRAEAITDDLTQLYNRRYLFERFGEERARAARAWHPLAVLMLDIDKFKGVNDTYGHKAGDIVLRDLASLIRTVVRTEDIVARYGGEEFCVLLPGISLPQAEEIAERLRAMVEHHPLPPAAGVEHITVSIGLATMSPDDRETEAFSRADLAMYEVKRRGGNHVCIRDNGAFFWYGQEGELVRL